MSKGIYDLIIYWPVKTHRLGVLDSALISGTFTGGGGVNSQQIMPRLAETYDLVYFPRSSVVHRINEEKKCQILKNIEKIEDLDIKVSPSFKSNIESFNQFDNSNFQKFRNNLITEYAKEIKPLKILYENDFSVPIFPNPLFLGEMYELSRFKGKTKFGITLRGFGDINFNNSLKILLHTIWNEKFILNSQIRGKYISLLIGPLRQRFVVSKLIWKGKVDFIGYINSYLVELFSLKKSPARLYDLSPAEASRFAALDTKKKVKNQIVFFGRLVSEKGIFEIPHIAYHLKKLGAEFKIKIIGRFTFEHDNSIFNKLVGKLGVDDSIEYLGFLTEDEMVATIGSSKIFVNPSHSDAYSIAMLEALSMGVPVVAYGIPFLTNLYKDMQGVSFVKEFDAKSMAIKIAELLSYSDSDFVNLFDKNTNDFIASHSSYDMASKLITSMIDSELI